MKFIKQFSSKGRVNGNGSVTIKDGHFFFRLPSNVEVVEKGYIEGGIGFVVQPCKETSSLYRQVQTRIDPDCVPTELRASHYKFRIIGKRISDTEFVFLYKDAVCLTHK